MTGAMHKVHALVPHGHTGHSIELRATSAIRETEVLQLQMPLQHQRVHLTFFVSNRTQRYGACNISGAIKILCARVEQQQPLRAQRHITLGRRLIMHNGAVGSISSNGVEREVAEQWLLGT